MNTNEQQWHECPLEEATHIKTTTGQIYELDDDGQVIIPGGGWVEVRDFLEAPTPVRKSDARLVEFTMEFVKNEDGTWRPAYESDFKFNSESVVTFRCVEMQP